MTVRDADRIARRGLIAELWNEGLSGGAIAERLGGGLTRCSVIGIVHRLRAEGWKLQARTRSGGKVRKSGCAARRTGPVPLLKAEPAATAVVPEPWRCRAPACRGTRQPGRDFCAEHIKSAQAQRRSA